MSCHDVYENKQVISFCHDVYEIQAVIKNRMRDVKVKFGINKYTEAFGLPAVSWKTVAHSMPKSATIGIEYEAPAADT
jgi:hypothetical protein